MIRNPVLYQCFILRINLSNVIPLMFTLILNKIACVFETKEHTQQYLFAHHRQQGTLIPIQENILKNSMKIIGNQIECIIQSPLVPHHQRKGIENVNLLHVNAIVHIKWTLVTNIM